MDDLESPVVRADAQAVSVEFAAAAVVSKAEHDS